MDPVKYPCNIVEDLEKNHLKEPYSIDCDLYITEPLASQTFKGTLFFCFMAPVCWKPRSAPRVTDGDACAHGRLSACTKGFRDAGFWRGLYKASGSEVGEKRVFRV